jgi:hypothetical protein
LDIYTSFTQSLAFDNEISFDAAQKLVIWLTNEGVLDNAILNETYSEAANDA